MGIFSFAWKQALRDWRNNELRLLFVALILSVTAVTAVGFFTDRIDQAMLLQANEILAADLVLSSNNPIPDQFSEKAREQTLSIANTLSFPSVLVQGDETQLVAIKAVSKTYPLRGTLRIKNTLGSTESLIKTAPTPGKVWVDSRLVHRMNLTVGDKVSLGETEFEIEYILSRDPSDGFNLFRLGPRILISLQDIPATGLITPASRVRHQVLIAGQKSALDTFQQWAKQQLTTGISLRQMSNSRPEIRQALERGSRFLNLAALVTLLIAGAAIALATQRFTQRQMDASAIMRCLGTSRAFIVNTLLIRLLLLACLATLIGSLLGYLAQFLLTSTIGNWFDMGLPLPTFTPIAVGLATSVISLIGFTLPVILRLGSVPPLRVLRRDLALPPASSWLVASAALTAIWLLIYWQAGDFKLAVIVTVGTLITLLLLLGSARLLVWLLTPLRHSQSSLWRYGLAGLARAPGLTAIQLTGFGLGILALLLLTIIRFDLMSAWQRTIPDDAPNQFLINIQPDDVEPLSAFMQKQAITLSGIYPMYRARLIRINDQAVSPSDYPDEQAQRLLQREFNLSTATQMQSDNKLVAGKWWEESDLKAPLISLEKGIAETLNIQLNDQLTFDLAGTLIQGTISNLRTVKWDSFKPNFFVITTPGVLENQPANYITSFYLPPDREKLMTEIIGQFPSVTAIDVNAMMQQIRGIITRGSLAVEYVFLFTLIAGLLVLYAGIQASREHRRQESAILRTLGLQRRDLLTSVSIEFFTLGLLAGILATLCAHAIGWFIATELFDLEYQASPMLWLIGIFGSSVGIGLSGVAATYPLIIQPPLQTLRDR